MFLKVNNDAVVEYPYWVPKLKEEYPNCSFPDNLESDLKSLASFGVFKVELSPMPQFDPLNFKIEESAPLKVKNNWTQKWKLIKLSSYEKSLAIENKKNEVISLRNSLLAETDWTQCRDVDEEISKKWTGYRQALRDIPSQKNFPSNVQWPLKP